jgi:hypothetical protein
MKYNLFIDDVRLPVDCANYMPDHVKYRKKEWIILRSYNEVVKFLKNNKIEDIEHVSYDHDLADEHYDYTHEWGNKEIYNSMKEKTGYDCAKYIVDKCMDANISHPQFDVHSMNPVGKNNIIKYIENYNKFHSGV